MKHSKVITGQGVEPNTSVCNFGGDVQSSRKSKSNADVFLYEVLTFIGDGAQGGVNTEIPPNKGLCLKVVQIATLHTMHGAML